MKLSIVIPAYNEENTIVQLLERVHSAPLPNGMEREVIVIDDGSHDGTTAVLMSLPLDYARVIRCEQNQGKGSAVRAGMKQATGDIVMVQDADMEYDPHEYDLFLGPILSGKADVVYGSRFVTALPRRVLYFSHYLANQFLTFLSNMLTGLNLSDMEVGYKMFSRKSVNAILPHLTSNRFGIEAELTALVARKKLRLYEVGISYHGRTYSDGKKINWRDGLAAIYHIIRFNLFR